MNMNLITSLTISAVILAAPAVSQAALNSAAGTDYANAASNTWIDSGPASESLKMVNFLFCVMENSNATEHVNQTYSAMIDEDVCYGQSSEKPSFVTQTLTTSRVDNDSAYNISSWFLTAEKDKIVAEVVITEAPSDTAPRGVVTLTWNQVDAGGVNGNGNKGKLSANADGTISYVEYIVEGSNTFLNYVHGTLAADGLTGNLRTQTQNWQTSTPVAEVFEFVFNKDLAHYKHTGVGSTAVCLDRTVANMTTRTFGYNLFTEAGAEKAINGPFDFIYTDSASAEQRGWAGLHGVWLQGGETGAAKPTSITRNSNSKVYTLCYDDGQEVGSTADDSIDDVTGGVCGTAIDGINLHLEETATSTDYPFDAAIQFDVVTFDDLAGGASATVASLQYDGAGSNLSLGWQCFVPGSGSVSGSGSDWMDYAAACSNATNWRPKYAMASGTELTETGEGTKYYVKATQSQQNLVAHTPASDCTSQLPLAGAPADAGYTAESIPVVTTLWSDIPTVTAANTMKVIHGVNQ
jgi:hypothetical protein